MKFKKNVLKEDKRISQKHRILHYLLLELIMAKSAKSTDGIVGSVQETPIFSPVIICDFFHSFIKKEE